MKLNRKICGVLSAAVIFSSILTACGGNGTSSDSTAARTSSAAATTSSTANAHDPYGKYEEPITLTAVCSYVAPDSKAPKGITPETNAYVKLFKEKLNIDLQYKWIASADQYDAKLGASMASGDMPDILWIDPAKEGDRFNDLREQGALKDIREAYNQYASEGTKTFFDDSIKSLDEVQQTKELYALPNGGGGDNKWDSGQMYYRKDWLDKLGMKVPTNIAELDALLEAASKAGLGGKPGDPVIPANKLFFNQGLADFTPVFGAYGSFPSLKLWYEENGKLVNPIGSENTKKALTKLNEWYKKGYIAKDFAGIDIWAADNKMVSDIVSGKYGITGGSWWVPNWPLNTVKQNDPKADWVAGVLNKEDGTPSDVIETKASFSGYNVVSASCEHPEALIKMINLYIDTTICPGNPLVKGTEKENWGDAAKGYIYSWLPFKGFAGNTLKDNYTVINKILDEGRTEPTADEVPFNGEFWDLWAQTQKYKADPKDTIAWGMYYSRVHKEGGMGLVFKGWESSPKIKNVLYQDLPSITKKGVTLDKLMNETFIRIIMGETPISEFDKFVKDWRNMGGAEIEKEVNEWYKTHK